MRQGRPPGAICAAGAALWCSIAGEAVAGPRRGPVPILPPKNDPVMTAPMRAAPLLSALAAALALALAPAAGPFAGESIEAEAESAAPELSFSGAYLAARSAFRARNMTLAADYLLAALAEDPGNPSLLRQAHVALVSAGRAPEALAAARKLVAARDAEEVRIAPLTVAVDAIGRGAFDEAADALGLLPLDAYHAVLVPLLEGWLAAARGDPAGGLAAIGPAAMEDGYDGLRARHIAMLQELAGDAAAARAAWLQALELPGAESADFVTAYGGFLERQGRPEAARALYTAMLEALPAELWPAASLARLDRGEPPPAAIDSAREGAADAMLGVAREVRATGGPGAALYYAQLVAHLAPENDAAHLLVGELFGAMERYGEAVAAYDRVDSASPLGWSARLRKASGLDRDGETERALALLARMAQERPGRTDALAAQGDILRRHERWLEAVAVYDNAFARKGAEAAPDWRLHYMRGIALERSGDWDRAERDFVAALEIEPEQPFVLNYLGYTWVDRGERLARALEMIERAVEQRPNDGFIVDSLGWAFYRLERFDEAVTQLERAVELEPDDPVINDHLGDAFWRVGRFTEARFQWRRALSLAEDDETLLAAVQTKLRSGLGDDDAI